MSGAAVLLQLVLAVGTMVFLVIGAFDLTSGLHLSPGSALRNGYIRSSILCFVIGGVLLVLAVGQVLA